VTVPGAPRHRLQEFRLNTEIAYDITPVWKNVGPELADELVDLWGRAGAIADLAKAAQRATEAVCIARDADGILCGVGTAVLRVPPRLRQPMYTYRQFFSPRFRGGRQTVPFFNHARKVLQEYNAALAGPESLGVLVELENARLAAHYDRACMPEADSVFIGYSPRGLQLRASYFDGARLFAPLSAGRRSLR
jgi:hypothetical protein